MTKESSFKRAARARAQETGEKYTTARAAMESASKDTEEDLWQWSSPAFDPQALKVALEDHYEIHITSMAAVDGHHPATLRIERSEGPPWVARVTAIGSKDQQGGPVRHIAPRPDLEERVAGDAEVLRWLEEQSYPAERLAHDDAITVGEGWTAMVTEHVPGGPPPRSDAAATRLGELLGRLHSLPLDEGAPSRDGGAFCHEPAFVGRPAADLAAATSFLRSVESRVDPKRREKFEWLLDQVANADDCEGLPEALTHPNFGRHSTIRRSDGELVVISFADAGRGPRLATLGWLLSGKNTLPGRPEAYVRGYARHVRLTDDEIQRLPAAVLMRDLYLACWDYRASVATGYTPSGGEGWWPSPDAANESAALAISAYRTADDRTAS